MSNNNAMGSISKGPLEHGELESSVKMWLNSLSTRPNDEASQRTLNEEREESETLAVNINSPDIHVDESVIEIQDDFVHFESDIEVEELVVEAEETVIIDEEPVMKVENQAKEVEEPVRQLDESVMDVEEIIDLTEPIVEIEDPIIFVDKLDKHMEAPEKSVIKMQEPAVTVDELAMELEELIGDVQEPVTKVEKPAIQMKEKSVTPPEEPETQIQQPIFIEKPFAEIYESFMGIEKPIIIEEIPSIRLLPYKPDEPVEQFSMDISKEPVTMPTLEADEYDMILEEAVNQLEESVANVEELEKDAKPAIQIQQPVIRFEDALMNVEESAAAVEELTAKMNEEVEHIEETIKQEASAMEVKETVNQIDGRINNVEEPVEEIDEPVKIVNELIQKVLEIVKQVEEPSVPPSPAPKTHKPYTASKRGQSGKIFKSRKNGYVRSMRGLNINSKTKSGLKSVLKVLTRHDVLDVCKYSDAASLQSTIMKGLKCILRILMGGKNSVDPAIMRAYEEEIRDRQLMPPPRAPPIRCGNVYIKQGIRMSTVLGFSKPSISQLFRRLGDSNKKANTQSTTVTVDYSKGEKIVPKFRIKSRNSDWRLGPAKYWYDKLGVSANGKKFDYGFKRTEDNAYEEDVSDEEVEEPSIDEDAFLMVTQRRWEDDVIWDGSAIKKEVLKKTYSKQNAAGWIPSTRDRTAHSYNNSGRILGAPLSTVHKNIAGEKDNTWYSIFPVDNDDLVNGHWEKDVIWDAENMDSIPEPSILTLDPNDENIILGIPDDIDPCNLIPSEPPPPSKAKPHPHVKKSKILLSKAGVIKIVEEDAPPPAPKSPDRNPYNLSNDPHYLSRSTESLIRLQLGVGTLIQHATPLLELRAPFIPTFLGTTRLRNLYRPNLPRVTKGALSVPGFHPVRCLDKHILAMEIYREAQKLASGGNLFFMRSAADLTGTDGTMILLEFCEEYPPLMNQVGMGSKLKNYYRRRVGRDPGAPPYIFGETAYAHTSPFLGNLYPGETLQTVENNMYRAPLYRHRMRPDDFIIVRSNDHYCIRTADAFFLVGQQCPLFEVPGPNSKRANNFMRDFLQVFIYRLFWESKDMPRRIKMDEIRRAFPTHSESSIRKRLKLCADFKRTGMDSNWWVIKPDFRLPSEEEIRSMVSPEQCCAYFSMIAAEQRLKDAGYGDKFLFSNNDDEDDDELQLKMDDEIKIAPWNTTRAYIQTMKSKCLLQLNGPGDPTGCGEGFSYIRIPNKPIQSKEEQVLNPKRTVTGTDADLRRLSLTNAKALLRKFGIADADIKKLSRWEVIDVVRTLSTEKAKAGEEGMDKFSRGNRFSIAEHQERYKDECQRIFNLQNRVLANPEELSSDDEESDVEIEDIEEMGKNIEKLLSAKKTSEQIMQEREEKERKELRRFLRMASKPKVINSDEEEGNHERVLKITRTFHGQNGLFTRVQFVRKSSVIDAYIKARTTQDDQYIRQFDMLNDSQKKEMKREKRRIQEQLRRIKRNQERARLGLPPQSKRKANGQFQKHLEVLEDSSQASNSKDSAQTKPKKNAKAKPELKLRCGACGNVGHMRTNKSCPMYPTPAAPQAPKSTPTPTSTGSTSTPLPEAALSTTDQQIMLLDQMITEAEAEQAKEALKSTSVSTRHSGQKKRKRSSTDLHCDYLKKPEKPAKRRRTDPVVEMTSSLESILNDLRDMPDVQPFLFPVSLKQVPDYTRIVQRPMDLQTIRENLREKQYQDREKFLIDVHQIVENSTLYNGPNSPLTLTGQNMLQRCVQRMCEMEEKLMELEKAINPLLDDDQSALTFILENVLTNKLKAMDDVWPFLKPVDKKKVKDYYNVVTKPMDLEMITKKVESHKYHSRYDFLADVNQILENCILYNGKDSQFTVKARQLVTLCKTTLDTYDERLAQIEANLAARPATSDTSSDTSSSSGSNKSDGDSADANSPPSETDTNGAGDAPHLPKSKTIIETKPAIPC